METSTTTAASIHALEHIAQKAELRARLARAIKELDWISREEAAAYMGFSTATLDRYLQENARWIRPRNNGTGKNGRKSIYRRDLVDFHLKTARGGEEISSAGVSILH